VITEAALYLATAEDAAAALAPVAGRPVALRMMVAAARAGCRRVWVPVALRQPALERLVARTPSARATVAWAAAGTPPPGGPLLLVPAAGVATPLALAALGAASPDSGAALGINTDAPVVLVTPAITSSLWAGITGAEPIGDAVVRTLRRESADPAGGWYLRVSSPPAAREAERRLFASLGSPIDTRLDRLVHRRLSRPVTRLAIALGVTPNQLTLTSLALGLAAAWCFWDATPARALLGFALYVTAVVVDHSDGEVARLTLRESRFGEWLDLTNDTVVHAVLVLALGTTAEHVGGWGFWAGVAAAAGVIASAAVTKTAPPAARGVGRLLSGLGNRDGYYVMLLLFMLALVAWPAAVPFVMGMVAIGSHGFWLAGLLHRFTGRR
jgi:phosphatidylglycerophosphate synthase